jgi:hypothetical protein
MRVLPRLKLKCGRAATHAALQYWKKKSLAKLENTRWYWVKPVVSVADDDKTAPIDIPVKLKDGAEVVGRIRPGSRKVEGNRRCRQQPGGASDP